jgi:hypothetical protein
MTVTMIKRRRDDLTWDDARVGVRLASEAAEVPWLDTERFAGAGRPGVRSISTVASVGVPNTWMLVVASIVSAYALVACSATSWMRNAIESMSG